MRAVIQRVSEASVSVDGGSPRAIGAGLMVLAGVEVGDSPDDAAWVARKVARMRIFPDGDGQMNLAVTDLGDAGGDVLVVSQFTLHASTKKGNRPSFLGAARPDEAVPLYESFLTALASEIGKTPVTGEFGADMAVSLINDGPVTITLDSQRPE